MEETKLRRLLIASVTLALMAVGFLWFNILTLRSGPEEKTTAALLSTESLRASKSPDIFGPTFSASAKLIELAPLADGDTTKTESTANSASPGRFLLKAKTLVSQSNVATGKVDEVLLPLANYLVTPETVIVRVTRSENQKLTLQPTALGDLRATDQLLLYAKNNILEAAGGPVELIYIEVLPPEGDFRQD